MSALKKCPTQVFSIVSYVLRVTVGFRFIKFGLDLGLGSRFSSQSNEILWYKLVKSITFTFYLVPSFSSDLKLMNLNSIRHFITAASLFSQEI